jgi:hypothetical protein
MGCLSLGVQFLNNLFHIHFTMEDNQSKVDSSSRTQGVLALWSVRYQVKDVQRSIIFYTQTLSFNLDLSKQEQEQKQVSEPVIIELGNSSKAGSVSGYGSNPVKEIFDFMQSNGLI